MRRSPRNLQIACNHAGSTHFGGVPPSFTNFCKCCNLATSSLSNSTTQGETRYSLSQMIIEAVLSRLASFAVIKKRLESGEESRTRLGTWVCGRFQLQDVRGKPSVSSRLKALRDLEREGQMAASL